MTVREDQMPDAPSDARPEAPAPSERPAGQHRRAAPEAAAPQASPWRTVSRALAPRLTRAQLMAGLLCALLGFALVVQVQNTRTDGLTNLRQDELVRILDEVTQRAEDLEDEAADLRAQRAELASGSDSRRAAREAAAERAAAQGILAGRLPAVGPGVSLVVRDQDRGVPALVLYNVLEELRNAGAEAVQINDVRLTASSYFVDTAQGVEVDGVDLDPPYRWLAIGDPEVITPALEMPGGALAAIRSTGGDGALEARDQVEVEAVKELEEPRWATPVPGAG